MRNRSAGIVLGVIALAFMHPGAVLGQGAGPRPEYFGFYALDGNKLIAIGGGKSDTPATLQQIAVSQLSGSQPGQRVRPAVLVGGSVHFMLFDVSPADAARSISIYRLPFVRSAIIVSDVPNFSNGRYEAQSQPINLPGMMRLSDHQIRLLQKPVPSQAQMIELVPDPPLAEGLYGVLFAPATSIAAGGAGAGQSAAWTAILLVGQAGAAAQAGPCIDITLTGGLGGMINADSPDTGSISSFPLLNPGRARPCPSGPGVPGGSGAASPSASGPTPGAASPGTLRVPYHNRETANSHDLAQLIASLERGENVVFVVRKSLDEVHRGEIGSHEVVVSKTEVAFREKGGAKIFSVTPDKLLALSNDCIDGFSKAPCPATPRNENNTADEPKTYHIRVNVAVINSKGKEEKQKFDFYHPAAGSANGTNCVGCDASMDTLYALLQKIKDNR